jgi:queuine/archaeosine tRNA-ribosyltransferase
MPNPRIIDLGTARLQTPSLLAGYRIRDYPQAGLRYHPWAVTNTNALLLNAFDLIANRRTKMFTSKIRECPGRLHEYVEFRGPIILDSGAFNFMREPNISISPIDIVRLGAELKADLIVALDHPFMPNATAQEIKSRLATTLENTRLMVQCVRASSLPMQILPVLHGHNIETLKRSLDGVVAILGEEPKMVGLGSLAPLALNGSKRLAVDIIIAVRQMLPSSYIHCFSMGSALLMLFAFYCGADTVDSQSWIKTAAFKQAQLPGFYQTRLSRSEAERDPIKYERKQREFAGHLLRLTQDEGYAVREWDTGVAWPIGQESDALKYVRYLEDEEGLNHIHRRACHNLSAFNFEVECVRKKMETGTVETFIQTRVRSTLYLRVFEHAVDRTSQIRRASAKA